MEIFGKHIFGTDAEAWLKLCKEQKKEWILKHTAQSNEYEIKAFVSNPKISKECKCLDCGKHGNISKGISKETINTITADNVGENSGENSVKRQRKPKKGEN